MLGGIVAVTVVPDTVAGVKTGASGPERKAKKADAGAPVAVVEKVPVAPEVACDELVKVKIGNDFTGRDGFEAGQDVMNCAANV